MEKELIDIIREGLENNWHSLQQVVIVTKEKAIECVRDHLNDEDIDWTCGANNDHRWIRDLEWEEVEWTGDKPEGIETALVIHDTGDSIVDFCTEYRDNYDAWGKFAEVTSLDFEQCNSWKMALY